MPRARIAVAGVFVLVLGAVAVILATSGGHGGPTRAQAPRGLATHPASIQTPSFVAATPAGWALVTQRSDPQGARFVQLSSTGAQVGRLGIGPAGTSAITITESVPGDLGVARIDGRPALGYTVVGVLPHVIGQPREAVAVVAAQKAKPARLAGAPAAEAAWAYQYRGRGMMQVDMVVEHGGRLFTIELDAEAALAGPSQAAVAQLLSSWRWR